MEPATRMWLSGRQYLGRNYVPISERGACACYVWRYLFTAFVGLNLFQSVFTNWCPMMSILRKLGVRM